MASGKKWLQLDGKTLMILEVAHRDVLIRHEKKICSVLCKLKLIISV